MGEPIIRCLYATSDGAVHPDLPADRWPEALKDRDGVLWLDITGAGESVESILQAVFRFHPLAVADALNQQHIPRVDDWDDYLYCVLGELALASDPVQNPGNPVADGDLSMCHNEIDMFLGPNYLVTLHDAPSPSVDFVWTAAVQKQRKALRGPDHVMYEIMDRVTTAYMSTMDDLDAEIDRCEDSIFEGPSRAVLNRFFDLKRALLDMRRILSPTRELLNRLARDEYSQIDPADRIYFRDVYDHLVRLVDINESLRDLVTGAMDMYISVVSTRLNEIMKVLTIWTVLFMPLGFITGFLGMNFFGGTYEISLRGSPGPLFAATSALMLASVAGLVWWMKRRGWMDGDLP